MLTDTAGAFSQGLHRALRVRLSEAGLLLRGKRYAELHEEALRVGALQLSRLRSTVGKRRWKRAQVALPGGLTDDDYGRVLGFGAALTRLAVSPLPIPSPRARQLVELGALTNFIVGLYDVHLDGYPAGGEPLSRDHLVALLEPPEGQPAPTVRDFSLSSQEKLFVRLVREFIHRLTEIADDTSRDFAVKDIATTVIAMYDAQHACHRLGTSVPSRELRRKGALPMVVMGAPAWLVADLPAYILAWHRSWLFRLGEFLAFIDDSVDLDLDAAYDEPNRIERLVRHGAPFDREEALAAAITSRGVRLCTELYACGRQLPRSEVSVAPLAMVVTSWLNGPPVAEGS